MYFKIYGVTLFCPNITITISSAIRCLNRTQITLKSKQQFPGLVNYILFSVYFPILSSKDDISFRHELGSAHVKFDRLNQQSNLIVWVDLTFDVRPYLNLVFSTANRVMFCEIYLQSATHITTDPRFTYLFYFQVQF